MFEEVRKNKIKSWILIFLFIVIIVNIGAAIGFIYGSFYSGMILATVISIAYIFFSYLSGDKTILKPAGARES